MTTPNTIVDTMNKAHSHGVHAEKAHPYTTIQNWSTNVLNLVTQRAIVEEGGTME